MERQDIPSGFSKVDQGDDPVSFVRRLDMTTNVFGPSKHKTFENLVVQEGQHLLDVGCGTGEDTRALARLVGRTGRAIGMDRSEVMITEARGRAGREEYPVEFFVGDAHHLPFPNDSFDGCRAYHIFMHLEAPDQALAEMVRVVRPGGRVVICDPDIETWLVDAPDRSVTRRILNFRTDGFHNGWVGRQLPGLFQRHGLQAISIEPTTILRTDFEWTDQRWGLRSIAERAREAGVVSNAEAAAWVMYLEEAGRTGRFFAAFTMFIVSGVKPR